MTHEIILKVDSEWRHFREPQEIIRITRLEDVLPALREVERLVEQNGWVAAGFISYEAAAAFDPAMQTHPPANLPLLWFACYRRAGVHPALADLLAANAAYKPAPQPIQKWKPTLTRAAYQKAIAAIKAAIARGDTYQVNYTFRLRCAFDALKMGDPLAFFQQMVSAQPVAYAAYLDIGSHIICSASPELFFTQNGDLVTSRPMKGTAPRGRTLQEDRAQAAWLAASAKNRAENVMIVDMIRNDLGRIARTGSVRVPTLFAAERYRTLWQMTSTVQAETSASVTETIAALFPCASITGAPKISTMRLIRALETTPRGVYTGAIGFIAPGRQAQFNVAIRTVSLDRETRQAEYGVGSGVVWDSSAAGEYDESLLKARILTQPQPAFDLLETLRWTPAEGYFLRQKHLQRLLDSAEYFGITVDLPTLEHFLDQLAASFSGPTRARITLTRSGILEHQTSPLPEIPATPLKVTLAPAPLHSDNRFLYHKTTHRSFYHAPPPGFDDVLHYNQRGELTEFGIGNLVAELNGELLTPPVDCGLLPGVFRAHLLEQGQLREQILRLHDLPRCARIFRINSVRGWQACQVET